MYEVGLLRHIAEVKVRLAMAEEEYCCAMHSDALPEGPARPFWIKVEILLTKGYNMEAIPYHD